MGKELFCDLCRRVVPIESALSDLIIGGDTLGQLCLNCASTVRSTFKKQMAEVEAKVRAAEQAAAAPQKPPVQDFAMQDEGASEPRQGPAKPGAK